MATVTITDTQYDSFYDHNSGAPTIRSKLVVTATQTSETNTSVTVSISISHQVKSSQANTKVIRHNSMLDSDLANVVIGSSYYDDTSGDYEFNVTSSGSVTCTNADTWYTLSSGSATRTYQKGTSARYVVLYNMYLECMLNGDYDTFSCIQGDPETHLLAIDKKSYTITPNANGGTLKSGCSALTKPHGTSITLWASSLNPTRSNSTTTYTVTYNHNYSGSSNATATATKTTTYSFSKWNTVSSGTGTSYNAGATYSSNANATLYAQWATSTSTTSVTLRTPTRSGYTFGGWYKESSCTNKVGNAGASYTPTASITLYAKWTANTFTITYKPNGASGSDLTQTKTYGVAATLKAASAFSRSGYTFKRWNTSYNDSGTGYNAGASYTTNAALTVYAIWNRTVTYNANGGSGAPSAQTDIATNAISIPSTAPTYTGYAFDSWNTAANGSGTSYQKNGSYPASNPSVTLYAQWIPQIKAATIGTVKVIRVDSGSSTTESDEGEYAYVTVPYTVTGPAAGSITMTVTATASVGDAPTVTLEPPSQDTKAADTDKSGTFHFRASGCATDIQYSFTITVTATNTTTGVTQSKVATKIAVLPTAFFTMDFLGDSLLYNQSEDTSVDSSKVYFTRTGSGTDADPYVYAEVESPSGNPSTIPYYEANGPRPGHGVGIGMASMREALDVGIETFFNNVKAKFKSGNIDVLGQNPTSSITGSSYIQYLDANGNVFASFPPVRSTTGRNSIGIYAYNYVNGENQSNVLRIGKESDGTNYYSVTDPEAFRNAINAVECPTQSAMNAKVTAFNTGTQAFGLRAIVTNSNNSLEGHELALIVSNDKLTVYDLTASSALFRYDTVNTETTTASSIATAASNVTLGSCTYRERNGVAMFSIAFTPSEAISSSTNVFTLVSGKRPAVACNGVDTSSTYSCYVQTNGNVQCRRALSADTTYTFRATYLLA